jgi:hypothetical protein
VLHYKPFLRDRKAGCLGPPASSYRTVNGQKVALEEFYAPPFDSIMGSFTIKGRQPPTHAAEETEAVGATAEPTATTAEGTPQPTPGEVAEGGQAAQACRFAASGSGPISGWTWLRDEAYRDEGRWECAGLPVGAPLPVTLTTLVTNRADGGSGYSAPAELTVSGTAAVRENKVIHTVGKCSAWRIVVGCVPMVDGGLLRPICID